jgi:hypothetical protein
MLPNKTYTQTYRQKFHIFLLFMRCIFTLQGCIKQLIEQPFYAPVVRMMNSRLKSMCNLSNKGLKGLEHLGLNRGPAFESDGQYRLTILKNIWPCIHNFFLLYRDRKKTSKIKRKG